MVTQQIGDDTAETIGQGVTWWKSYTLSVPNGYRPIGIIQFTSGQRGSTLTNCNLVNHSTYWTAELGGRGEVTNAQIKPSATVLYVKS